MRSFRTNAGRLRPFSIPHRWQIDYESAHSYLRWSAGDNNKYSSTEHRGPRYRLEKVAGKEVVSMQPEAVSVEHRPLERFRVSVLAGMLLQVPSAWQMRVLKIHFERTVSTMVVSIFLEVVVTRGSRCLHRVVRKTIYEGFCANMAVMEVAGTRSHRRYMLNRVC